MSRHHHQRKCKLLDLYKLVSEMKRAGQMDPWEAEMWLTAKQIMKPGKMIALLEKRRKRKEPT